MPDSRQYHLAHTHITAIRNAYSRMVRIETTNHHGIVIPAVLILGANVRGAGTSWEIPIHSEKHINDNVKESFPATEFEIPGARTRHFHTFGRFLKPGDEIVAHVTYGQPQGVYSPPGDMYYWVTLDLVVERHTSRGSQSHWFNMAVMQIPSNPSI